MARPIKNNADYFPHDADMRNDPRIKALRRKFGIEGYGTYAMLLEFITDSEYFELKNTSLSLELIAGDFDIDPLKLEEILRYCFQLDLFQLDSKTNIISCKSLDNRLEPLLSKRKRDRIELPTAITPQNGVIDSESTQSKVKESKVKESKGTIDNSLVFDLKSNPKGLSVVVKESGLIAVRIHQQSFEKYMDGTFAQDWEQQKMTIKPIPPVKKFFEAKNGDIFNNPGHLWSSFKKMWLQSTDGHSKPNPGKL